MFKALTDFSQCKPIGLHFCLLLRMVQASEIQILLLYYFVDSWPDIVVYGDGT